MAKTKISRKDLLKKPDEFLTFSAKAIIFAKENSRYFTYLGIAVVCLFLIYLGANTYSKYINKKGQNAYNIAYYAMQKIMGPDMDKTELQKAEEQFQQVIDKYGSSKAGKLALPEMAYIKFLRKQYDEAISMYREFLGKLSDNDPYQSLARMALAVCYEEKGDFEMAIQTLEQITSGPDDFFKEQSMLNLARVLRLANKTERSNTLIKEFIERYQNSPFLPMAKTYLNNQ
ncbi:MAG: tetratricopeptide repeat protein [Deltaproteobacteria bacterium]|nr:tetratricopeptide repeat protein [Deltaproteobacteria bacterium]